jgi:hypothetical protein
MDFELFHVVCPNPNFVSYAFSHLCRIVTTTYDKLPAAELGGY